MDRIGKFFQKISLCAAFGVFILIGLLGVTSSHASDSIKVAMITAKTGDAGLTNIVSFEAARFAVDEINDKGGILGRAVELLEYDNYSTPEGSTQAAMHAIEDGAHAVVGCNWSSHSLAMAKVLQTAGIPMISHLSTNEAVTRVGDYIFRACFIDSFQGSGMARFAREKLRAKTAVVLVDVDRTYSKGLGKSFVDAYEKVGGTVLWRGEYSRKDADYDTVVKKVAELKPEALFVPGSYEDVAGVFGRVRDLKLDCALLSADGIGIRLYDFLGNKADGVYYSGHWSRWADTPVSKAFVEKYEAEIGPAQVDTLPLVYDSFMLFKDAIERAGSVDGCKIRDALAATEGYVGVTGTIRFDENGDPIKPLFINMLKFGGIMFLDQVYP